MPRALHRLFARLDRHRRDPPVPNPAARPLSGRHFVLDATNITLLHGPAFPELRYVLAIADYLLARGADVDGLFDASTPHLLREHRGQQLEAFERLTTGADDRSRFRVVPGGTEADEWILKLAKQRGSEVLSNDQFRDRARRNPWIWKRRHAVSRVDDVLYIAGLDARIGLRPDIADYDAAAYVRP